MQNCSINLEDRPRLSACSRNFHSIDASYQLGQLWSLHLYGYHASLIIDGTPYQIHPGCVSLVPPGAVMDYHFEDPGLGHIYAHFALPKPKPNETSHQIAVFTDLRVDFSLFQEKFELIAGLFRSDVTRAEVKLWDLLLDLAARREPVQPRHPSLEKAIEIIELRLAREISVNALAREVGLSHNQLTRLFRQDKGSTAVAYIRRQRAQRALHLLLNSTMPVKAIAAEVNAADLTSFSALMKKETGHTPGFWRRGG